MDMLKIRKFLSCLLFGFLVISFSQFFLTNSTYALNSQRLNKYSNYQIYFYDPDAAACLNVGGGSGGSGGGGSLSGNSRIEKIWNYIKDLGISGLSDSAEAIAGVIGNMSVETGGTFNPFIQNSVGCTGLIQWCNGRWNDGFFSYMKNKGFDQYYYKGSQPSIDEDIINDGIKAELDFLFNGSGAVTASSYIANLGVPGIKDGVSGARAYADLFLVTVENAYGGGDTLEDSGVASIAGHSTYQAAGSRRDRAETIYNMYGDNVGEVDDSDSDSDDSDSDDSGDDAYCYGSDDSNNNSDDDYERPEAGNLADYVKKWAWPSYEKGKTEQMPAYADYMKTAGYKGACSGNDCGAFVSNIIVASGWDTSYPLASTTTQKLWLARNWEQVDASSLRLGDVGVKKTGHHVILYVGDISGFNSKTASASQCDRAPMAGSPNENLNNYTWYRKR